MLYQKIKMVKGLDEKFIDDSSHPSLSIIEEGVRKNPFFYKILDKLKGDEKKEFIDKFNDYLESSYKNNPQMRRLLKGLSMKEKVKEFPDESQQYLWEYLKEHQYSVSGRDYNYLNATFGENRKKKGLLKRIGSSTWDFGKKTFPAAASLGGASYLNYWANRQNSKGLLGRIGDTLGGISGPLGLVAAPGRILAKEGILGVAGSIGTPLLFLTGGYFLYKTLRYFLNKRKEKKEREKRLQELYGMKNDIALQNQFLSQNIALENVK